LGKRKVEKHGLLDQTQSREIGTDKRGPPQLVRGRANKGGAKIKEVGPGKMKGCGTTQSHTMNQMATARNTNCPSIFVGGVGWVCVLGGFGGLCLGLGFFLLVFVYCLFGLCGGGGGVWGVVFEFLCLFWGFLWIFLWALGVGWGGGGCGWGVLLWWSAIFCLLFFGGGILGRVWVVCVFVFECSWWSRSFWPREGGHAAPLLSPAAPPAAPPARVWRRPTHAHRKDDNVSRLTFGSESWKESA